MVVVFPVITALAARNRATTVHYVHLGGQPALNGYSALFS
jgi:hypothetical protein